MAFGVFGDALILSFLVYTIGGEHSQNDLGRLLVAVMVIVAISFGVAYVLPPALSLAATGGAGAILLAFVCEIPLHKAVLAVGIFAGFKLVSDVALTAFA